MIAERSPIGRVRISSLDPEELSDRIISIIAQSEKFCPHFHLPLQAGEDDVLARMRRRYTTAHFRERVERILEAMPDAAIGTDLIVGFPGETRAAFRGLLEVRRRACRWRTFTSFRTRCEREPRRRNWRQGCGGRDQAAGGVDARTGRAQAGGLRASACSARKLKVLLEERPGGRLAGYSRNYVRVLTEVPQS